MKELKKQNVHVLAYQTSKNGNVFCGDSYYFTSTDEYFVCVVADGLGSGEFANEASAAVIDTITLHHSKSVEELMDMSNKVLVKKRGAAVCIFKVDYSSRVIQYSSVGNIRFFLYSSKGKLTYPLPVTGFLSGRPQVYHTQSLPVEPNDKFLIFTDGYNIQGVKSLLNGFLPLENIADLIIKKYANTNDDATFILGSLL